MSPSGCSTRPGWKGTWESADPLVLVVSEEIHSSVVRHGYDGIDHDSYQPLVRVCVAGATRAGSAAPARHAAPGDERLEDYPASRLRGRDAEFAGRAPLARARRGQGWRTSTSRRGTARERADQLASQGVRAGQRAVRPADVESLQHLDAGDLGAASAEGDLGQHVLAG